MINRIKKIREEKGTALLVALLVMGVLIALSLALSSLVLRELRLTKDVIDAGKAYYAAESAIEHALLKLDQELPGWDTTERDAMGEKVTKSLVNALSGDAVFEYQVKNKCNSYPCFDDEEYDVENIPAGQLYEVLELNESITIPLFTVEGSEIVPVEDFNVQFFVNFSPKEDLKFTEGLSGIVNWDVLRWKVFTMKNINNRYLTESIHDFTGVAAIRNSETGMESLTIADYPSWFGTKACQEIGGTDKIQCEPYPEVTISSDSYCQNTEARDYYIYNDYEQELVSKIDCYPIDAFMIEASDLNRFSSTGLTYLSLTNMVNPSMLNENKYVSINEKQDASRLFFRLISDQDTVREFADIKASGYSGESKQSISVKIKRDSFMPVFNFSLYSTYKQQGEKFYEPGNDPYSDESVEIGGTGGLGI